MSPRPDTWMPMYWGDYTRDTGNLSATCHGAYLMLIKHYWCSGSPLENDDDDLWRIACCDGKDDWLRIRPKLLRFFYIDGNLLRHKRIDAELAKARARVESRAEAGRVGANRRWGNNSKAAANASDSHASANGKPIADPLPVPLGEPSDSQWQNDGKSQSHYPSKEEIPHSPPL
ncbi:MAG: DUF1376 domain-containing protein, partial [Xanthomonadaceae bacterium]|nr:DUF1376 domain-containing protein [Xanthomonadaceae bacterium]